MSTRPARAIARVAPRPDVRRLILIAATIATAAAAFISVAGAQSAPAPSVAVTAAAEPDRATEALVATGALVTASNAHTSALAGPRMNEGLVVYKPTATSPLEALAANEREMNRPASRRSAALIVVGLSALVIGSVVDDDAGSIIVLGGAGITLYGLWQYLR